MRRVAPIVMLVLFAGCFVVSSWSGETKLPLEKVPEHVRQAALEAIPGIELVEAELEEEDGRLLYELEGTFDGKHYEIEITESGEVVEVEQEDQDDEDGDDDGDDDDDEEEDDD